MRIVLLLLVTLVTAGCSVGSEPETSHGTTVIPKIGSTFTERVMHSPGLYDTVTGYVSETGIELYEKTNVSHVNEIGYFNYESNGDISLLFGRWYLFSLTKKEKIIVPPEEAIVNGVIATLDATIEYKGDESRTINGKTITGHKFELIERYQMKVDGPPVTIYDTSTYVWSRVLGMPIYSHVAWGNGKRTTELIDYHLE